MQRTRRRKTPPRRQRGKESTRNQPAFEKGQVVKLAPHKKAPKAVVLGPGKKPGTVVIRYREAHHKEPLELEEAERRLYSALKAERGRLLSRMEAGRTLSEEESARFSELGELIFPISKRIEVSEETIRLTHTRAVPESSLYPITRQEPKTQRVPRERNRLLRREEAIRRAGKMKNPKRAARFLSGLGISAKELSKKKKKRRIQRAEEDKLKKQKRKKTTQPTRPKR